MGTMLSMTVSAMSLSPNTVPSVSTQVGCDDEAALFRSLRRDSEQDPTLSGSRWAGSQSSLTMSKRFFGRGGPASGQTCLRHSSRASPAMKSCDLSQDETRAKNADRADAM